ncbi:LysR family transcriptional regulator [Pseudooceanicola sp.]|uniref:LysR family transcriptional regulator n=1 Tax=Pseudooceanicola sp. TaxID=1914328 RepID=UPI000C0B2175|nr:LysR family transcriptional regulator [Pseudooceanicola sp.]
MPGGLGSRVENWDDLRYLMAVDKTGSMSAAARLLATNPATVSRRLARLSEALGYELFHKTPEGWVASDSIRPLLHSVAGFEGELESILNANDIKDGQLQGTIAIGMSSSLANGILYPRIGELFEQHPGVRLTLHSQTYRDTLGENDLIISPMRPQQGRLIVRPIGAVFSNVYCMPGSPRDAGWIGLLRSHDWHTPMQRAMELMGRCPTVRLESLHDTADAIRASGLPGVTLRISAAAIPGMTLLEPESPDNEIPLYLCYHETRRKDPLLQAIIAWVTRAFDETETL